MQNEECLLYHEDLGHGLRKSSGCWLAQSMEKMATRATSPSPETKVKSNKTREKEWNPREGLGHQRNCLSRRDHQRHNLIFYQRLWFSASEGVDPVRSTGHRKTLSGCDLIVILWKSASREGLLANPQISEPRQGKDYLGNRTGYHGLFLQFSQTLYSLARFCGARSSTWT